MFYFLILLDTNFKVLSHKLSYYEVKEKIANQTKKEYKSMMLFLK